MEPTQKAETILVVDGDVLARAVIADYLRNCGYRVIEAQDAREAQHALEQEGPAVDVILADVELPGEADGFQLAQWVRENRAPVKVVLSSKVEQTAEIADELCDEAPNVRKPYEPLTVLNYIRKLMGGSGQQ
jgi:CheY-like chemotaxis protein